MRLTIFTSPRFADHLTPPGHPERVDRFHAMQTVASDYRRRGGDVREPRPATDGELTRVHAPEYVARIRQVSGRTAALDADTFTSPDSVDVARLAAGAAIEAVDHVLAEGEMSQPGRTALALVRPPGHHAERDRAMGFCLFNNIAIAAAHARSRGLARVAIVDFDVHHGNGTQAAFYDDASVLFISSHQFPYYPGTGASGEVGHGPGEGFTLNLPLAAGANDADYELVYARAALPVLRSFRPELILVSAGFDAFMDDPLGGMQLSADYFGRLMALLVSMADDHCGGRIVAVTEGGYDLRGLAESLHHTIRALSGESNVSDFAAPDGTSPRGEATLAAVRAGVQRYWQL